MKVKFKDDEVKIKMTREQAKHLRSLLLEADLVQRRNDIGVVTEAVCSELDVLLGHELPYEF